MQCTVCAIIDRSSASRWRFVFTIQCLSCPGRDHVVVGLGLRKTHASPIAISPTSHTSTLKQVCRDPACIPICPISNSRSLSFSLFQFLFHSFPHTLHTLCVSSVSRRTTTTTPSQPGLYDESAVALLLAPRESLAHTMRRLHALRSELTSYNNLLLL